MAEKMEVVWSNRTGYKMADGRFLIIKSRRPPQKGEFFLKPSGRPGGGQWWLLQAENDHQARCWPIVDDFVSVSPFVSARRFSKRLRRQKRR